MTTSVVDMINVTSTSCKNCMVLIRILVFKGLIENVRIFARHVEGVKNKFADSLSRDKISYFHKLCKDEDKILDACPTPVSFINLAYGVNLEEVRSKVMWIA